MNTSATIADTLTTLEEELATFTDWEERYSHIIALGKGLAPYPEEHRTDALLVKGCQSRVWLHASAENGRVQLEADSDALIVKGLAALLLRIFNNRSPQEILDTDSAFIGRLGLDQHLSQNRANGLANMLKQIKLYALAFRMVTPA